MTTEHDAVHTYLMSRGCSPIVVRRGLSGLLDQWTGIVASVERGRDASLDEWLNDMDLRDILAGALAAAQPAQRRAAALRLAEADARFLAVTEPSACLWGDEIAHTNSWRPEWQWWYFRRPTVPGPMLREDLLVHGYLRVEP
ncbi:MAG: hypothetical protein U5K74_16200 [Gemmatimonadaceae bacterium]|nr:hypothetical protein [Gemmatimonadaceae bacterium]